MNNEAEPATVEIVSRAEAKARGLKFYATGRACKNGHVAERYLDSCECTACATIKAARHRAKETSEQREVRLAKAKVWRDENPEITKSSMARWRAENREYELEQARAYRQTNKAKITESNQRYYVANREKELARIKEYHAANKETVAATQRAWKQAHPDAVNAIRANRRAREIGAEGSYTDGDVQRLLKLQKCKCAECRKSLKAGYHVDHIVPLSRFGSNHPANLQLLCQKCNNGKYDKDPIDWAREKGRLL